MLFRYVCTGTILMMATVTAPGSVKKEEKGIDQSIIKDFKLARDNELRFEVETNERVKLDLVDGSAEIFGTELVRSR